MDASGFANLHDNPAWNPGHPSLFSRAVQEKGALAVQDLSVATDSSHCNRKRPSKLIEEARFLAPATCPSVNLPKPPCLNDLEMFSRQLKSPRTKRHPEYRSAPLKADPDILAENMEEMIAFKLLLLPCQRPSLSLPILKPLRMILSMRHGVLLVPGRP